MSLKTNILRVLNQQQVTTVGCLARFNSNPGIVHWHAVKHLLCYLKGTADYSITYAPDPSSSELFSTFSDADHGGS
jgi:hypothetical protein